MPSPFSWQTTLDSGVVLGFTGKAFGSLATPTAESGVDSSLRRQQLNHYATEHGYHAVHFMHQTHSCTVIERAATHTALPSAGFDGHYSSGQSFSLGVLTADCLPILVAGTNRAGAPLVAAVHAGRVGLLGGIIQRTSAMLQPLTADEPPLAVIGPAICGGCYEVPEQMQAEAQQQLARIGSTTTWDTPALDLPAAAEHLLRDAGFRTLRTDICTLEDPDYYSYRGGDTANRNAGVILTPAAA